MDYTTLAQVRSALRIVETADDAYLSQLITEASRALDRICARSIDATDFFKLENLTDEVLIGQVNQYGHILCWPHKPKITTVTSLTYRFSPLEEYRSVDVASRVEINKLREVEAWTFLAADRRGEVRIKISYTGGFSASPGDLPADFTNLAALFTARFYRETEAGLSDVIGLADLTTATYTKALPQRLVTMIKPFVRTVPW